VSRRAPLPTFLIVGAMKSGTTSLIHTLGAQPQIFAPTQELHFFSRRFDDGVEWYRDCFSECSGEPVIGETSPEYMYRPEVAQRVRETLPDVKLVAILRNPVDRAYSHYWHNRTRGHEPLGFGEALKVESERLRDAGPRRAARFAYVGRGLYAAQIQRLIDVFDADRVHVVVTEDLRANRLAVLRPLLEFLGADSAHAPALPELAQNRFVTFRSQRARGVIRRLPRPLRLVVGRANVRYGSYPPMAHPVRVDLAERFADSNRELGETVGVDVSAWWE
jgi:hypothetical protein